MTSRIAHRLLPLWLACVCACPGGGGGEASGTKSTQAATPAAKAELPQKPVAEPTVVLMPPGRDPVSVKVEVARTEDERRRGLMFRKQMDESAGMLFLFDRAEQLTFWMHNTYIPLDMIFIDPEKRILGVVENAEPLTDAARAVPGISQYVLEVNAGFSRRNGLGPGTAVRFDNLGDSDAK